MTIETLAGLYRNGYSSKFDFYLGLIDILSQAEDPVPVLEKIPTRILNDVLDMAGRHLESSREASRPEESRNPEAILRWWSSHPSHRGGDGSPENGGETRPVGSLTREGLPLE